MNDLKAKITDTLGRVKTYWKTPMKGRYMPFREIAVYSGGGIGVYFLFTIGSACLLGTGNTLISSTLGVDATDMYVLYVIAVLANIPMTAIRAHIIDNTKNKAGKYRPYIVRMGIPTALACITMVWFPYNRLGDIVGEGEIFGESRAYVAKCAIILVLNLILHFCYYFFYDGYENLIHVLSPNTQERADVTSVKSVVYSFSPTLTNLITPIIAQNIFKTNTTDLRVYRLLYPIFGIIGIVFCIVVYSGTKEKIVQARTHVVQIRFIDAIREVSRNKYFWIISLAGWIGFLELSYVNILFWLYNYGGVCSGNVYGIIVTIYGNASLWGMIMAPFCIRRWGKKAVLVVTNIFNIIFILMMLPVTTRLSGATIWLVMGCLYLNAFMGSFALILNPAIQADIRDYQQYRTGERIDGMFSAVGTIGTIITLLTSSVLPMIYERGGLTKENAAAVTSDPAVLSRVLGDGKTVGQILSEQLAIGQDNYSNSFSALYDPDILLRLLHVLIIVSAVGALMNVIPYIWYDFSERKQKGVVSVLKVRAMSEDYANGALSDEALVEGVEVLREARACAGAEPRDLSRGARRDRKKQCRTREERKAFRRSVREDTEFNDKIAVASFVTEEINKFSSPLYARKCERGEKMLADGLEGLRKLTYNEIAERTRAARAMPRGTAEEKAERSELLEECRRLRLARKAIDRHFSEPGSLTDPGMERLESFFDEEDSADAELKHLYAEKRKKTLYSSEKAEISEKIKLAEAKKKNALREQKKEMDRIADFTNAARPWLDAEKLLKQRDNYSKFEEIEALYDEARARINAEAEA